MRHKLRLLIFIIAALAWIGATCVGPSRPRPCSDSHPENEIKLGDVYKEYNEQYFNNRLPADTIIDWSESGSNIATTVQMSDKRYHIAFNPKYALGRRVYRTVMLHEQCHVKTFDENDFVTEYHGPRWRSCMLQLDMQGAFRRELIDYYFGN